MAAFAQEDALSAKSRAAKQALAAGRNSEAIRLYRELVKALPDNPGLRFNLGLALIKGGQPAAAISELQRATESQPEFAPAWFLLGLAHQQLGKPRDAITSLRTAVRLDAGNTQAQVELADAELAAGQPRDAAESFGAISRSHPEMAKAWQGLGLAYIALGERAHARLSEIAPGSAYEYALAARARAGEGRYAEALALYQEAIRAAPRLPQMHAARAEVYRLANRAEWAEVEKHREAGVPRPDCAQRQAACAFLARDWPAALAFAEKAATAENLYWAVLACDELAQQSFQRVAALPPSAEIHELLAESNQRSGRRIEAIEEWRKALTMAPNEGRLQGRLAESLIRNRQYDEAARLLQPLVAALPDNGEWQYLLGEALFEQRRAEAAVPHLLAAERLVPNQLGVAEVLGRAYLALGQTEKAITRLQKALPLDDGSISFALSTAYRRLGREADAAAALNRYRQLTQKAAPAGTIPDAGTIPPP
jgi:tetratricopeptide (TPR) repeat protein